MIFRQAKEVYSVDREARRHWAVVCRVNSALAHTHRLATYLAPVHGNDRRLAHARINIQLIRPNRHRLKPIQIEPITISHHHMEATQMRPRLPEHDLCKASAEMTTTSMNTHLKEILVYCPKTSSSVCMSCKTCIVT